MDFISRLRTPGYSYNPVGRNIRRDVPIQRGAAGFIERGTNPFVPQRPIDRLASMPHGIDPNAPNVVYDQGPELAREQMKMQKDRDRQTQLNRDQDRQDALNTELDNWKFRRDQLNLQKMNIEALADMRRADMDTRRMNADTNRYKAQIAEFKAMNPNMVFQKVPGGNIIGINPQTGEQLDTGINSGLLTDADLITQKANAQMMVNANKATDRPPTTAQHAARALQSFYENPEFQKYIKWSDDGKTFDITAPGGKINSGYFGMGDEIDDPNSPTQEIYDRIIQSIFGGQNPQIPNVNTGALNGGTPNQLNPGDGYKAAPGQYDAKPGQYDAPKPGEASKDNKQSNEQLKQKAIEILEKQGKPVTDANIAYVIGMLEKEEETKKPSDDGKSQARAGEVTGTPAGVVSGGKPAGVV